MIKEFETRSKAIDALALQIAKDLTEAIKERGKASLSVPGGTTPAPLFARLRAMDLGWAEVSVLLNDERFVPEASDRSNTRLIKETLLQDYAAAATYVPLTAKAEQPEAVLNDLIPAVSACLPLDVLVLGMGADMHTASLFPGADLLDKALSEDAPVLLPMRAAGAPEPRITLTARVLRSAQNRYLLMFGSEKRAALEFALQNGPEADAPVRVVLDGDRPATVYWADD